MKKKSAIVVALSLIIALSTSFTAFAETYFIIDDLKVYKDSEATVGVAGYEGTASSLEIPTTVYDFPVTVIADHAFNGNIGLSTVTLPQGITKIGVSAFYDSKITSINIPSTVTEIGMSVFYNCTDLKTVSIEAGITEIPGYTFNRCSSLETIVIPSSVTSIGEYAFYNCTSLKNIKIPASVTEISDTAFEECPDFTITGEIGSYAQTFADENSIKFSDVSGNVIAPTEDETDVAGGNNNLKGDVNSDDVVNQNDITLLRQCCIGLRRMSSLNTTNADVNSDGKVNIKDAVCIQLYLKNGKY